MLGGAAFLLSASSDSQFLPLLAVVSSAHFTVAPRLALSPLRVRRSTQHTGAAQPAPRPRAAPQRSSSPEHTARRRPPSAARIWRAVQLCPARGLRARLPAAARAVALPERPLSPAGLAANLLSAPAPRRQCCPSPRLPCPSPARRCCGRPAWGPARPWWSRTWLAASTTRSSVAHPRARCGTRLALARMRRRCTAAAASRSSTAACAWSPSLA